MKRAEGTKSKFKQAGEDLFNFAIDRNDVKILISNLPQESSCKPETVEYELQLLKIISTGWSILFFLEKKGLMEQVTEAYWKEILEFSRSLSEKTTILTGQAIDYFQFIKDRLAMYVAALAEKPDVTEPAAVIGPEFARHCGNVNDVFAVMTGSRMFIMTVARVREYLNAEIFAAAG